MAPSNFLFFFAVLLGFAALLLVPGFVLRVSPAFLPLPGLALLALAGAAAYALGPSSGHWAGGTLVVLNVILAARLALRRNAGETRQLSPPWPLVLGCYAALVAAVALIAVIRAPVGQEFWEGTGMQSRMPASPPDNAIPYKTAAYLIQPSHDAATSERYFGDWSAVSRGPLVPLLILAAFDLLPPQIQTGADPAPGPWPAAADSFYAARILGILTNACVLFGAAALLDALGTEVWPQRCTLLWLALAPVTWINVAFVWPKLLATYFLFLAAALALRPRFKGSAWAAGTLLAAGYLAHPVGGLFAPPTIWLLAVIVHRQAGWRAALGAGARALAAMIVCLLPWFLIKWHVHAPELFAKYPWGDGRGLLPAQSLSTWLATRWGNLWYSLVPGAFWFSGQMRVWLDGPLSAGLRWAIQYAKTLPAGIGFVCMWLPASAAWRRRSGAADLLPRTFALHFLVGGFVLALVFWGFSGDGLGRNCLEPLELGCIVWAGSRWPLGFGASRLLFALLWLETSAMIAAGFAGAAGFALRRVAAPDALLFVAALLVLGLPWCAFSRSKGARIRVDRTA